MKVTQLCPTLCDPMDCPWNSLGQHPGISSLSLLQGIFPTEGSNPGLRHCRRIPYQWSHKGSPEEAKIFLKQTSYASKISSSILLQPLDPMVYSLDLYITNNYIPFINSISGIYSTENNLLLLYLSVSLPWEFKALNLLFQ